MTPEEKLSLQANRLLGEYIGTLEGVLLWAIPEELKVILQARLVELQKLEITPIRKSVCIHSFEPVDPSNRSGAFRCIKCGKYL